MYRQILRPLLFGLPPAWAHALGMAALAPLEYIAPLRSFTRRFCATHPAALGTTRLGLRFASPLGLAGGFDKNAARARALASLGFGFIEVGTVTHLAQTENPRPNLFRLPEDRALINRLGFPNEGADRVVRRVIARGGAHELGVPLAISIGKSRAIAIEPFDHVVADYVASFRAVQPVADFVIVNVSSPNTKDLRAVQGADLARTLLRELVAVNQAGPKQTPLLVKIAPDLSEADLEALLSVVDEVGLDGIIATNTTTARSNLVTAASEVDAIGAGGLSGPPLRSRTIATVRRIRARLGPQITIIGVGGIETAAHAFDLIQAGANLLQLYTGFIYEGPGIARRIASNLAARLERDGVRCLDDLVGSG